MTFPGWSESKVGKNKRLDSGETGKTAEKDNECRCKGEALSHREGTLEEGASSGQDRSLKFWVRGWRMAELVREISIMIRTTRSLECESSIADYKTGLVHSNQSQSWMRRRPYEFALF